MGNFKNNNNGFGGKGRLTDEAIDRLQNYYGIVTRQIINDIYCMTKAIHATLFHVGSSAKNNWKHDRQVGESSRCGFITSWGYSSVVEHSTADREVPGSNPGVP